jgi:hypothetical protein
MSGHLLASVNQEAADNIRPLPVRQPLPGVGEVVIYTMRPGHGRNGQTRFPALVMGERGGKLLLTVIIDAGDMVDESHVEEAGPGNEFHCWERPQPAAATGLHGTVAALHERIGALEEEFRLLQKTVLGGYEHPKISIIDIMQEFETRLRDLKRETQAAPADGGKARKRK